jgi:hypothetical protein
MKLRPEQRTAEPQNRGMSNVEGRRMESLRSVFYDLKSIEYLTSTFDIRHSLFDIRPARNALKAV